MNVSFAASDRGGLERLCRYVLRPPLALGRLERLPDGRVFLVFKPGSPQGPDLDGGRSPDARRAQAGEGGGQAGDDGAGRGTALLGRAAQAGVRGDGWACPHCNKPMKLRSIVIREPATTQVVSGLLRATGPPAAA